MAKGFISCTSGGLLVKSLILLGLLLMTTKTVVEARYRRHTAATDGVIDSIPHLLNRVYDEVGHDQFHNLWKEFNSRNSDEQDDFLMADLSDDELAQLGTDFENLGMILATDPKLVDLYADFEHNLNTHAFNEMDQRLSSKHTWWGRIKKFLQRKLEKLADEIYRKEHLSNSV